MTDKLEDASLRLKDEMELNRKMMDKLRQSRSDFQKEREALQEVSQCPSGIPHWSKFKWDYMCILWTKV